MTALEFLVLALAGTVAGSPSLFLRGVSPDNTCGTTGNGGNPSAYTCPADLPCCSVNGWCGSTGDYCLTSNGCQAVFGTCEQDGNPPTGSGDDGNSGTGLCGPDNGNVSCATNECCSAAGYCGTTPDHCKAPDCLFQFGPACDANKIPPGLNTSSIVRTKLGQVEYGGPGVYSCVNPGDVALTYDDGPASYTNDLLDLLKKYNAKATFMITGNNNAKGEIDDAAFPWVSTIKRMYADGHQIASHTWSHADLCKITSAQRRDEMYKLEMAIRNIIGVIPTYMRPPYSSCTAECGCEDDMRALGYSIIYFDLDTADYLHDSPTEIQQSKDIVDQSISVKPATTDNFLVIGHDIHQQTVYNLTEYMLQKFQGKKMVTVGECLGDPKANWYRADVRTTLG
ncbi:Putative chitin-binding, type 1, NodB domain, glycoside hydrolase/deacetylase, beta/alpha-barrel [Colletotrichum destructivum]|uniref:Chitin-binding, type 1, NodB domain, glycoside hydrolase/deacetylase, beta/alpha-barrel n=1 Tax=Colletotrichum destructivum TaxID=34406 RepID=A0AAX4IP57_9PEZI|nr:Putative chitin-binding, type 1, NodB domain, glycoside hydrolase/deacetylase, beta/alpha-barrel [Colletotrichum destructivum]